MLAESERISNNFYQENQFSSDGHNGLGNGLSADKVASVKENSFWKGITSKQVDVLHSILPSEEDSTSLGIESSSENSHPEPLEIFEQIYPIEEERKKVIELIEKYNLTPHEFVALFLIPEYTGNGGRAELAKRLEMNPRTLKNHLNSLYSKLGVSTINQAILFAIKNGIRPFSTIQIPEVLVNGVFSDTERNILDLLAEGLSNEEIAQEMYYSCSHVKNKLSKIFDKLGIDNRSQALLLWIGSKNHI